MNSSQVSELHTACKKGNNETVQTLLINCPNHDQALAIIAKYNNINLIRLASEYNIIDYNWGLTEACQYSSSKIVAFFLDNGADNYEDGLLRACRGGKLTNVQKMIEMGAKNIIKAFYEACEFGQLEIIAYLNDISEEINDKIYESGLIAACYGNQLQAVENLVELGATNYTRGITASKEFFSYSEYLGIEPTAEDIATNKAITDFLQTKI